MDNIQQQSIERSQAYLTSKRKAFDPTLTIMACIGVCVMLYAVLIG